MKYRRLTKHYSKILRIYGLLKMHTYGIPFRSIVIFRDSACHPLGSFPVNLKSPVEG